MPTTTKSDSVRAVPGPKDILAPVPEPNPTRSDSVAIVDAVVRAVVELDDVDASMNAIAVRAGVGVASLYRYFPNKPAIYAELSRRLQRDFAARLRAVLDAAHTVVDAIEGCCRLSVFVPGLSPTLRRALNLSVPLSWSQDNASATFRAAIVEMTSWLAGRMSPVPPDLEDRVFVAFSAGRGLVMISRLLPEQAPDDEALVVHMVRVARAAIGV
jgi:AcrR family transcriptional regulator